MAQRPIERSLEPSSFTHLVPKVEVAGVSKHAVLASDVDHSFFTLHVCNAVIHTGADRDLIGQSAFTAFQRKLCECGLRAVVHPDVLVSQNVSLTSVHFKVSGRLPASNFESTITL